jgi:hypothetical protein
MLFDDTQPAGWGDPQQPKARAKNQPVEALQHFNLIMRTIDTVKIGSLIFTFELSGKVARSMQCHTCQRSNDAEAIFCVYCGVRIDSAPIPSGGQPITGATVDLRRAETPAPAPARPAQARPAVVPPPGPTLTWAQHGHPQHRRHSHRQGHAHQGNGWGWLLLGLGALFLFKNLWWLLFIPLLFGITSSCSHNHRSSYGQQRQGKQAMVWIIGLGTLIATGWWIPGIFIVWLIAANVH